MAFRILDAFFPPLCLSCGKRIENAGKLCSGCFSKLKFVKPPFCGVCGKPYRESPLRPYRFRRIDYRAWNFVFASFKTSFKDCRKTKRIPQRRPYYRACVLGGIHRRSRFRRNVRDRESRLGRAGGNRQYRIGHRCEMVLWKQPVPSSVNKTKLNKKLSKVFYLAFFMCFVLRFILRFSDKSAER